MNWNQFSYLLLIFDFIYSGLFHAEFFKIGSLILNIFFYGFWLLRHITKGLFHLTSFLSHFFHFPFKSFTHLKLTLVEDVRQTSKFIVFPDSQPLAPTPLTECSAFPALTWSATQEGLKQTNGRELRWRKQCFLSVKRLLAGRHLQHATERCKQVKPVMCWEAHTQETHT